MKGGRGILPKILIIDDLFGRGVAGAINSDRENICANFSWLDDSLQEDSRPSLLEIVSPTAEAVFSRGQSPVCSGFGDYVENDLDAALRVIRKGAWHADCGSPPWSLVLLDLCFYTGQVTKASHARSPGMPEGRPGDDDPKTYFGLTILDAIHRELPHLPVFILSSKPRQEVSLEFSRLGALGFIDRSALDGRELFQNALFQHGLLFDEDEIFLTRNLTMVSALREARRAAIQGANVLIRGEAGSGKRALAQYLNRASQKWELLKNRSVDEEESASRRFVAINPASFAPSIFANELFGFQPKSASGLEGKIGLIEYAKNGDVFFEEVSDMPDEVQASLLSVIESRSLMRVGARKPLDLEVRFLGATSADDESLQDQVRPQFLERISAGGTIWIPPLRERKEDIPLLAKQFLRAREERRTQTLTEDTLEVLQDHEWPGNVRELRAVVLDAVGRFPDVDYIVPEHLRLEKSVTVSNPGRQTIGANEVPWIERIDEIEFDPMQPQAWSGKLPVVQRSQTRLVARMLQAALLATRRCTPENPQGEILIHPAGKLLSGDPKLTASQAADLIKRILKPIETELTGELLNAYQVALRLRPKSPK